ncbi:hypothetical protein TWF694_006568 [Orbilia ellipsospora]|uniref:Putative zinc-finger domain-containing protein n=1 Tax=Orbilia ellipsospora TaxID=2528407 RepID=A0AAV9XN35_9PEZI
MSTCPEVPSFSGIRIPPSTGKRAMPARRVMPKSRQASASAASAAVKTPTAPKQEVAKPKLTISLPATVPTPPRDDGPEEGEISDEEDDHYSPREASTPLHMSLATPLESDSSSSFPPKHLPVNYVMNSINGQLNNTLGVREQVNLNALRNIPPDPKAISIQELRKSALSAVMYLACSAKMSFNDIVSEGVDPRIVAKYFDQLRLPMTAEARELLNIPAVAPSSILPPQTINDIKPTVSTTNTPITITNTSVGPPTIPPPASLPPKPPAIVVPKPESVVSRFNQALPGLNLLQASSGPNTPPVPTSESDANGAEKPAAPTKSPIPAPASLRSRKRPVAADFDSEIKPSFTNPKQPKFGNRQSLEASHLIFDVSDNEDDAPKTARLSSHPLDSSRPDSTTPENNEQLGQSIREKEAEIELMRQKILAMSRKKKLANNGETGSGPPSKPPTPAPVAPSTALMEAKSEKLEQVEQFLHQTLDQIEAGGTQSYVIDAAMAIANAELMDVEAKTAELQIASSNSVTAVPSPTRNAVLPLDHMEVNSALKTEPISEAAPAPISLEPQPAEPERPSSDDNSFSTALIELDPATNEPLSDTPGSPMDLAGASSPSDEMAESELDNLTESSSGYEVSDSDSGSDESSDDDSTEESEDVEMRESSQGESPGSDSASSPTQEIPNDDYDPSTHKGDAGVVPLRSEIAKELHTLPQQVIGIPSSLPVLKQVTIPPPNPKSEEFQPYKSVLTGFKSFRYHPSFNSLVSQGFKSLTYSHNIDSEQLVCDFETRGGTCNDPQCGYQHFRQMALPGAS